MSWRSLREELEARQALKAWEIEEWLDRAFFRPVALVFTAVLRRIGATPDQVSVGGMLIGMLAVPWLFGPHLGNVVTAVVLLWVAETLDAADGQLARLRGQSSPYGNVVDGVCSTFLYLAIYLGLGIGLWMRSGHWLWMLAAAGAAVCHSLQSALYDFYRTEYVRVVRKRQAADRNAPRLSPRKAGGMPAVLSAPTMQSARVGSGPRFGETLRTGPPASPVRFLQTWTQRWLAALYRDYSVRQAWTTPTYRPLLRRMSERFRGRPVSDGFARVYAARQGRLVRWWNLLGPNSHLILLSAALLARRPEWYLWANIAAFNLYAVLMTWIQRGVSAGLVRDLRREPLEIPAHREKAQVLSIAP